MNCQEALSLLYDIIDKEASEIDTEEVRKHLENCRDCFQVYRLERSIQEFLSDRLQGLEAPVSLDALKSRVHNQLDRIDQVGPAGEKHRFFRRTAATWAAAASVVILIGGFYLARNLYLDYTRYVPLERAHARASAHPEHYRHNVDTFAAVMRLRDEWGYDIRPAVDSFTMIGGQFEQIMDVEMVHFLYCCNDHTISVFVVPAGQYHIPGDLQRTEVTRHGLNFYDHHCRGCRLVYHQNGRTVVITASRNRSLDLLEFVPGRGTI